MASIRQRQRKNGTTAHTVVWRENGHGKETSETFDDAHQATLLRDYLNQNGQSYALATEAFKLSRAQGPTMAEACETHVAGLTGVYDRTRADYRRDIRLHILPYFGNIRAGQITRKHVKGWVNSMQAAGVAPKSIANYHGLLSAIMNTCIDDEVRTTNPCKGVRLPERDMSTSDTGFIEPEEYATILAAIPQQWRPVAEVLAGTGMRWSEMAALDVADYRPKATPPFLSVTKAVKRDAHNGHYIGNPKTRRANREVTISDHLAAILTPLVKGRAPNEPLLLSPTGKRVSYAYFQAKVWTPAVDKAMRAKKHRLKIKAKIHTLRHSHGSWLLNAGVDLFTVQRRLGHESITTTTAIYGHIGQRAERLAATAISDILGDV